MCERTIYFIGSSFKDLEKFPRRVQDIVFLALQFAQKGQKHPDAKPLKGFGDAGVLEIIEDFNRDTYRAVYTVRFENAVYVLHAFKKKSKKGIKTAKEDISIIHSRLKRALEHFKQSRLN